MGSKDYFEKVAKQWDRMRESFFSEAVRDKALVAADVRPERIAPILIAPKVLRYPDFLTDLLDYE